MTRDCWTDRYGGCSVHERLMRRVPVIILAAAIVLSMAPSAALGLRAANYGYQWAGAPHYDPVKDNEYETALRCAYYQQLMGFTTMTRGKGTGQNIYTKLSGMDPNDYEVINILSHGTSSPDSPCEILCLPYPEDGDMSCLYSGTFYGAQYHLHQLSPDYRPSQSVDRARLQTLSSVPSVDWIMFQACQTGRPGHSSSLVYEAYSKGVATSSGFFEPIQSGPNAGLGSNGQTMTYNFAARYWQQLYYGQTGAQALASAAQRVLDYHGRYGGYNYWSCWGGNRTLN